MTDSTAILDQAILAELRELGRELGQDVLGEVVAAYAKLAPELLDELEAAAGAGARDRLVRAAHTLKGSSAQIGASAVRDAARALEVEVGAGRLERAGALVQACRTAFEESLLALSAVVGQPT